MKSILELSTLFIDSFKQRIFTVEQLFNIRMQKYITAIILVFRKLFGFHYSQNFGLADANNKKNSW